MIRIRGVKVIFDRENKALGSPDLKPDDPDYCEDSSDLRVGADTISLPTGTKLKGQHYGVLNQIRLQSLRANQEERHLYYKYKDRGAISNGAYKPEDVIPKMLDFLAELDPDKSAQLRHEWSDVIDSGYEEGVQAAAMWEELDNEINYRLPEGLYFGSNTGDATSYGVWQAECDSPHPSARARCDRSGFHGFLPSVREVRGDDMHGNGSVLWPNED